MTIEEKAKAYDEALERAKKAADNGYVSQDFVSDIFPELAESEDEKIRKRIIHALHGDVLDIEEINDAIAWLEKQGEKDILDDAVVDSNEDGLIADTIKQGEQKFSDIDNKFIRMRKTKPKDISEFLDRLTTVEQEFLWEHIAKIRELDKEEQKSVDIAIKSEIERRIKCFKSEKDKDGACDVDNLSLGGRIAALEELLSFINSYSQQKSVVPKFRIGDTIRFKGNETLKGEDETHKIVAYDNELYVFDDGTTDLFCEQDLYELVEQKPVVPSDENGEPVLTDFEAALFTMVSEFWQSYNLGEKVNIAEFVKEHAPLLEAANKHQNLAEWSEEDKMIIQIIDNCLESAKPYQRDHTKTEQCQEWLKSLRPQSHWKPSDEQMDAFHTAIYIKELEFYGGLKDKLISLYNDLKAL